MVQIPIEKNNFNTISDQYEHTKKNAARDKTQDQKKNRDKSATIYNHGGQKSEMNTMIQQASDAAIDLFFKKAKDSNKRKVEAKMNHIYNELDYLRLSGSVNSAIYGMEDIPNNY